MAAIGLHPGKTEFSFNAISINAGPAGVGQDFALLQGSRTFETIGWQVSYSAAPATTTVLLEASLDGSTWFTVDTSTNVNGEIRQLNGPYKFLRANNTVSTGGAGKTLTVQIVYALVTFGVSPIPSLWGGTVLRAPDVAISNASVLSMAATEVDIIAGIAGFILLPRLTMITKAAGAYTVAGVTALIIGAGTVADNYPLTTWGGAPAFSLLVNASAQSDMSTGLLNNGVAGGIPFGVLPNLTTIDGKKIAFRTVGASPAGAGGALTVKMWYEKIPTSFLTA